MTQVSAHELAQTHDCALPGCPFEAEHGREYCRQHLKPTNGGEMSDTVWCKRENCEEPAEDRVGPYAKLCATHKDEARTARAARPSRTSATAGGGSASLADLARKVVPHARSLDRARTQLAVLPSSATAKAAFDVATRRASISPSPENLARVKEAITDLTKSQPKRTRLENEAAQAERALGLAVQSLIRAARGEEAQAA